MNLFTQSFIAVSPHVTFLLFVFSPYIVLLALIWLFITLHKWARKRKAAALGLGMMMHMFMPVPNVEKSIVEVVEKKQVKEKKASQQAGQKGKSKRLGRLN